MCASDMAKIRDEEICPCGSGKKFGNCHGPKTRDKRPVKITQTVRLATIPKPDPGTRAIFIKTSDGSVVFRGHNTEIALICGNCDAHLVEGLEVGQIQGVIIKCNDCGEFNECPTTDSCPL